jgi:predicted RNA-binding protein (virulence factor B family)
MRTKRVVNADKAEIIRKVNRTPMAAETPHKPLVQPGDDFQEGQRVSLVIGEETRIGFTALINNHSEGILYKNEVFQPLNQGQRIDGFIKKIREDKKIDLSLYKPGYKKVDALADRIMEKMKSQGEFIPVTDKSPPKVISELFGISKKTYKMVVGRLYRDRLISIEDGGIRLKTDNTTRHKAQGARRKGK